MEIKIGKYYVCRAVGAVKVLEKFDETNYKVMNSNEQKLLLPKEDFIHEAGKCLEGKNTPKKRSAE